MKKVISAIFSKGKSSSQDLNCPFNGYYGGLLHQKAYGK